MTDQWVPGPAPAPPQWVKPLPPSNDWNDASGCAPGGPSIVDGILITGVPATVSSLYWQVSLNDGSAPPNFQINQLDGQGNVVSTAAEISPTGIWFDYPVLLSRDPVEPMEAVTLEYLEAHGGGGGDVEEAPMDNYIYGRYMATWERLPQSYIPEAPNTGQRFGRFNSTWQLDAIQVDAPSDGATYGRLNGAWSGALPIAGGTVTGSLTVNQVLTVQGSNSMVLNAPVTGGSQRSILGMAANVARWGLTLGDGTAEGLNNVGSNFSLAAYSTTGAFLGNWLTIARADGSTAFNGSGVTIAGGLAVNGLLALASPNNLAIYGGAAGQVLSTNGSGILSWANQALPPASTTVLGAVKVDGTSIRAAADGTISTVLVPMGDNRVINGNFAINQRGYVSATALAAAAYGHDRWKAGAAGCTYSFTAALPDTAITITAGSLTQIIEAGLIEGGVYTLSWTGTAQARVYQGTPAGAYAASPIVTASLPAGVNTTIEFNTGTVTRAKLEIGAVATPFNRQSLAKVQADCERYYKLVLDLRILGYNAAAAPIAAAVTFQTMRAAPTATVGVISQNNCGVASATNSQAGNVLVSALVTVMGQASWEGNMTLSAEL